MAEETEQQIVTETEGQSQNQEILDLPGDQSGIANALSGLVSKETMAELQKMRDQSEEKTEAKPGDKPAEAKAETPAQEKPAEEQKNEKPAQAAEKKNALGVTNKKVEKKPETVIETPDHILNVIKSDFGQEIKDIKELPKFFESAKKWRTDSQKAQESSQKLEQYEKLLEGLPNEFLDGIQSFYNGEDYMKAFSDRPKFNFDLPVEKQDIKALVNHYYKDKFTDEDFAEEQKSQALQIAESASIDKYNAEKQAKENQRAIYTQNAQKQLEAVKASVNSSVASLRQSFPDAEPTELKNVQSTLEGGINAVASMFFNQDGTVKPEAAERLMLAVHGKSVIDDLTRAAAHSAETAVAEEMLSRGNETRSPKKGQGVDTISDDVKMVLEDLSKFKTTRKF